MKKAMLTGKKSLKYALFRIYKTAAGTPGEAEMGSIGFTVFVALVPPVAEVFSVTTGLGLVHWGAMLGLAAAQLVVGDAVKLVRRRGA